MIPIVPPQPWMQDAKCRHDNPDAWDLDNYPDDYVTRAKIADRICEGCPVIKHCAQWAHDHVLKTGEDITGMVCAGIVFSSNPYKIGTCERARKRVAVRHDLEFVPRPRGWCSEAGGECKRCRRPTVARADNPGEGQVRYGAHGMCVGCASYTSKLTKTSEGQEE